MSRVRDQPHSMRGPLPPKTSENHTCGLSAFLVQLPSHSLGGFSMAPKLLHPAEGEGPRADLGAGSCADTGAHPHVHTHTSSLGAPAADTGMRKRVGKREMRARNKTQETRGNWDGMSTSYLHRAPRGVWLGVKGW